MKIAYIPEDAPFNEDQRAWISGFLAGLHSRVAMNMTAPPPVTGDAAPEAEDLIKTDAPDELQPHVPDQATPPAGASTDD